MKYTVFFRNLNLGRPNCPTKTQLETAFLAAGAESASSFLTNGTLVFPANNRATADQMLARARQVLQAECGLKEPAYLRSLDELSTLAASDPFASVVPGSVYACCVSFLLTDNTRCPALPLASRRGDVEVIHFAKAEVLSVSRKPGNTPGSPNAFLEKLLGTAVSTRNWNTVLRLLDKHG